MIPKRILFIGLGIIIAIILIALGFKIFNKPQEVSGMLDMSVATDLIGTKVGTTTTGVGFYGKNTASTTYPFYIGGTVDNVVITLKATAASSTAQGGSNVTMEILASNDRECNTATTTTIYSDVITVNQINWFDSALFLENTLGTLALSSATTTLIWTNPLTTAGKIINLTAVNTNCLALRVSASSTVLWAQYKYRGQQ